MYAAAGPKAAFHSELALAVRLAALVKAIAKAFRRNHDYHTAWAQNQMTSAWAA